MKKSHPIRNLRLVKSSRKQEAKQEVQVSLEITNDELTDQERDMLIKGAKHLLQDIFAQNPDAEVVVIDDTHPDRHEGDKKNKAKNIINLSTHKSSRKNKIK